MFVDVDECLFTVLGYQSGGFSAAKFVSEILTSVADYIYYRKLVSTPLKDIKQPALPSKYIARSYSSSEDQSAGSKGMLLRFRSLVEKPNIGAEKLYSIKQQLLRSASILRHRSPTFTNGLDLNSVPVPDTLKTASLDRRKNMPKLQTVKNQADSTSRTTSSLCNQGEIDAGGDKNVFTGHKENNNVSKDAGDNVLEKESTKSETEESENGCEKQGKDMDRTLDADVNDQEKYEQTNEEIIPTVDSKGTMLSHSAFSFS